MKSTILVAGKSGQVARSLADLTVPDFTFVAVGRPELDLADTASIERTIQTHRPVALVNAAAYTAVDKAESEPEQAFAINRDGAADLARAAARYGLPIIHISTDYVFPGDKSSPYVETDATGPLGIYGHSKLEGEEAVAQANSAHVILRTAWVFSPYGSNFLKTMLRLASQRDTLSVVADQHGTPTYAPDLADAIVSVLRLVLSKPADRTWKGIFHLVAEGEATWAQFAEEVFRVSKARGGVSAHVNPIATAEYPTPARRPVNSRLDTKRFILTFGHTLPDWRSGVERCIACL